jgi:hypothetical protein
VSTHYRRRATSETKIKLDNNEKLEREKGRMIRSKEKENFKQASRKTHVSYI